MNILILGGAGRIGSAVAWDLVRNPKVQTVGIVDIREEPLQNITKLLNSDRIKTHILDISDSTESIKLMKQYDVVVITLPDRMSSYKAIESAIEAGTSVVDILEEYHRRPDLYETEGLAVPEGMSIHDYGEHLHNKAIEKGITILDGMGLAPGLTNIATGEGIRKLDKAEIAVARVGGIPEKEASKKHPLKYMITWSFEHVLREYFVKLFIIKNGKSVEVDSLTERETFSFGEFGKSEELECAITPGMPSFIYTRPELDYFAEKTVRWPGHYQAIENLKECGLLDITPVEFDGKEIAPREFFNNLITPKLQPKNGDTDISVMLNTITGMKDGKKVKVEYYMWDEADTENNITSMARTTGFTAALGATLLAEGKITEKGIVPPEDCIKGDIYNYAITELEKRNIIIREVWSEID